ncbi:MAG TPA: hypothetical protein VNH46_07315, partial [Gemmatimonadales bacterium]|nr:hypothetical protein [Gemmatimonadales bacterium]
RFGELLADPARLVLLQTLFVAVVVAIAAQGLQPGLQRAARWAVPLIFALLGVGVAWQAALADGYLAALQVRLRPDYSQLGPEAVFHAASQAFFTLSLATGAVFTAGRCRPVGTRLRGAAWTIVGLDTLAAVLATLLILPSLPLPDGFVSEGPALLFVSLPSWLGQQPGGAAVCGLLYVALNLAALSSATVMLEPSVTWIGRRTGLGRRASAVAGGMLVWVVALAGALSFSSWRAIRVAGASLFDGLSFFGANLLLPLGGLGVALLAGWTDLLDEHLPPGHGRRVTMTLLRYVVPGVLLAILGVGLASW